MVGTLLPRTRPRLRRFAAAAAVLAVIGLATPASAAEPAFTLTGSRPPVGLGVDPEHDRYWVLSTQSGTLTLHAYAADGTDQGSMSSRDYVSNMQALAFVNGQAYVGDVGGVRATVNIYRVRDPWPGTEILHAKVHTLAYPDGSHRAEAILVDANHRMSVVTTGSDPGIYQAPPEVPVEETTELTRVADAPDDVTDGTVLADGRIVLRSATTIYTLDPDTYEILGTADIGVDQDGQSVTETLDSASLLTGASASQELSVVAVPGPAPTGPSPSPTASAPVGGSDDGEGTTTRAIVQTGTTWAIGAAIGVAALAALVVLIKRR